MEAVALPDRSFVNESKIKRMIVDSQRRLVPSLQLHDYHTTLMTPSMFILNDKKHVQNAKEDKTRNRILRLHGLNIAKKSVFLREYVISVFQTDILVMYRSGEQSAWLKKKQVRKTYQRISPQDPSKEVRKVRGLAIQALYALGLDYGVVICGIQMGNSTVVVKVIPDPKLNDEMETQFCRAFLDYQKLLQQPKRRDRQVLLGADPEFVMVNPKGNLLAASNYFPIKGRIGCDAIWVGSERRRKPLVEIRPEPTADPKQLATRIYYHLWQASKRVQHVPSKWLAGALPYHGFPIGGHIHFSGIKPNFKILRALDNYLALPFVIVEDERGSNRRPKYGFLGDYRTKTHGGFEYRTPPSWLVSPTLTKGALILAKLIALHYDQLRLDPLADVELQVSFYQGDKEALKNWFGLLWEDLKQLPDYDEYQTELDSFHRYILSGRTWDEKRDIRKPWRLPPFQSKQKKRA